MLKHLSTEVRDCYVHAEACARKAESALDDETRQDFVTLERSWLALAHSYEFAAKVFDYTSEARRRQEKWRGAAPK
jgi:hypothetical protein